MLLEIQLFLAEKNLKKKREWFGFLKRQNVLYIHYLSNGKKSLVKNYLFS
jgi:hypothetical protein